MSCCVTLTCFNELVMLPLRVKAQFVTLFWQHEQAAQFVSGSEDFSIYHKLSCLFACAPVKAVFHPISPQLGWTFTAAVFSLSLQIYLPQTVNLSMLFVLPNLFTALLLKLLGGLTTVGITTINFVFFMELFFLQFHMFYLPHTQADIF